MLLKSIKTILVVTAVLLVLSACGSEEERADSQYNRHQSYNAEDLEVLNIEYRTDHCDHDGSEIRAKRFGAELETEEGEHYKFCSAEHMIAFMMENDHIHEDNAKIRVVEFIDGGHLIHPSRTTFLQTPNQPSPGGMNFLPMESGQTHQIGRMHELYTGELLSWEEAQQKVAEEWGL